MKGMSVAPWIDAVDAKIFKADRGNLYIATALCYR
jgi:hypothetical protein